jgi:hypothetical protein
MSRVPAAPAAFAFGLATDFLAFFVAFLLDFVAMLVLQFAQ